MKTRYSVLLAGLAGIATGGIGLTAIHAQAPSNATAAAYYIADFELTDPEASGLTAQVWPRASRRTR